MVMKCNQMQQLLPGQVQVPEAEEGQRDKMFPSHPSPPLDSMQPSVRLYLLFRDKTVQAMSGYREHPTPSLCMYEVHTPYYEEVSAKCNTERLATTYIQTGTIVYCTPSELVRLRFGRGYMYLPT